MSIYNILRNVIFIIVRIIILLIVIGIVQISFIIGQKYIVFGFISAKFPISFLKLFCLLLLIFWILIKTMTFYIINITILFLWLTAIIIIVTIVSIIALVVLITTIILTKLTIIEVLNIGGIAIIMYYAWRLKLRKKFFQNCYTCK